MKISKLLISLLSFLLISCAIEHDSIANSNLVIINDGLYDINYDKIRDVEVSEILSSANEYKRNKDYRLAVSLYNYIIINNNETEYAPESQWQIADIYINDLNESILGIKELYKIVDNFPNSSKAENALFMVGYIYNNSLNSYSDAINVYQTFIERYPNSELIPSIHYELDNLIEVENKIKEMVNSK